MAKFSTLVLRAKSRKTLLSRWDTARSNSGIALRRWCEELDSTFERALRGSWNWEQIGQTDLQGLVRVDSDKAGLLLKYSGMCASDSRWFLEPLGWHAPLQQESPSKIKWIAHDNLAAAAKTAVDKAKFYGLEAALGLQQVGVRIPRSKLQASDDKVPRTWSFLMSLLT